MEMKDPTVVVIVFEVLQENAVLRSIITWIFAAFLCDER